MRILIMKIQMMKRYFIVPITYLVEKGGEEDGE
jgi:hypothetical protein